MIINSVTEIYFSPTGTTKKVIRAIAEGMGVINKEVIDITLPQLREKKAPHINGDIVLIGVPVYEERVPKMLIEFLKSLNGHKKPVVIVGVYGNVGCGIVLDELNKITSDDGFKVVAAASFIGEHSFSSDKAELAKNRPDKNDLCKAEEFGKNIMNKMQNINDLNDISLKIPEGRLPIIAKVVPEKITRVVSKTPAADKGLCNHCNVCADWCPVGAIDRKTLEINEDKCIRCFSCVKKCSKKARKIIYKPDFIVSKVLKMKNRAAKEPELFFDV